jgi:folylpolyglutamate synthase/dihydropteroate synthase
MFKCLTLQVSPAGPVTVEPSVGTSLAQQAVSIAANLPSSTNAPQAATLQLPAVPCRLVGQHQHSNIQAAVAAALLLRQQGWEVPDAAIAAGLSTAWLPGRFQVRSTALHIYVSMCLHVQCVCTMDPPKCIPHVAVWYVV